MYNGLRSSSYINKSVCSQLFRHSNKLSKITSVYHLTTIQPVSPVKTFLYSLLVILMAATMPTFVSRLLRPFSSSTRVGLSEGGAISMPEGAQKATVAAGCFWGVEHMYRKAFEGKGLYDARVGYIGGDSKNPSYRSVCSGRTGRMFLLSCFLRGCGGGMAEGMTTFRTNTNLVACRRRGSSSYIRPV